MKKNIGKNDRSVRLPLGILVVMAGFYFETWWGLLGLYFIITGFIGFSPFYKLFGITTFKRSEKKVVM